MRRASLPSDAASIKAQSASALPLEPWEHADRCLDYCLLPYSPAGSFNGAARSVNVLRESFALAGIEPEGMALVNRLREDFGPFRTVWGIKHNSQSNAMNWELYFYDHDRSKPDVSVENIRQVLSPLLDLDAEEAVATKRLMFSVEFSAAELKCRASVPAHVYLERSAFSYELRGRQMTLESQYQFHNPQKEIQALVQRVKSSVHIDWRQVSLQHLLPPELLRCHHICFAVKRHADALYFSRVNEQQRDYLLARLQWPAALRAFLNTHRSRFTHLLWDVGFDFKMTDTGLSIVKSGLYGTF